MIGIKAIATHIPMQSVDNIERAQGFGETETFVRSKIGALRLPVKDVAQETSN